MAETPNVDRSADERRPTIEPEGTTVSSHIGPTGEPGDMRPGGRAPPQVRPGTPDNVAAGRDERFGEAAKK